MGGQITPAQGGQYKTAWGGQFSRQIQLDKRKKDMFLGYFLFFLGKVILLRLLPGIGFLIGVIP